jgi:K+-sensing histidine kinase KdpD
VGMSDNGADTPPEGLGMAVVRSMASNLEGKLAIEPIEPGGTRMKVRFPAPDQADAAH